MRGPKKGVNILWVTEKQGSKFYVAKAMKAKNMGVKILFFSRGTLGQNSMFPEKGGQNSIFFPSALKKGGQNCGAYQPTSLKGCPPSCTARKCIRKCLLQNVGICPIFCVFSMGKLIRSSQFFPHTLSTSWKTKFALTKMHLKMSAKLRPFSSVLNVLYIIRRIHHDFPFSFSWQVHHREVGYHVFHDPWHRPSRYWLRHGTLHRHSQPRPQTTHPSQLWHWLFRSRCLAEYGDSRWEFKIQHMFKIFLLKIF